MQLFIVFDYAEHIREVHVDAWEDVPWTLPPVSSDISLTTKAFMYSRAVAYAGSIHVDL